MKSSYVCTLILVFFILRVNSTSEDDKIKSLPDQPYVDFNQYAGYVTVNENNSRKLFYYFVEAEVNPASKPVILWINGGPVCSSHGGGAFTENGHFRPTMKGLVKNPFSWNKEANMLYLDSPAGVGFSYSANTSDYSSVNDESTARDNLVFLQHWFTKFSQYRTNDFFIAGENYAGHYAPQLAQLILQTKVDFNLKGIAIGNPLLDFDTDFNSGADFLVNHGKISDTTFQLMKTVCNIATMKRQFQAGNFSASCSEVNHKFSEEVTGYTDLFNVIADVCPEPPEEQAYMLTKHQAGDKTDVCVADETITYMNRKEVQNALHAKLVGIKRWSTCSGYVLDYDVQNLENPTISILGTLVKSGVRVLVYSGDLDSVISFMGTRSLLNGLAKDFGLNITSPHRAWFHEGQVAGWTRTYEDILIFATVKGAGHAVPFSQPERSLEILKCFLEGKPLPILYSNKTTIIEKFI